MARVLRHPLPWILLFALLLRLQSAGHVRSTDDVVYGLAARDLVNGEFAIQGNFHRVRMGIILPVAGAFALFGVHLWAAVLFPLVTSLGSIAVLYRLVDRASGRWTAAVAALFLAVSTQHVLSGSEVFPDAPVGFWVLLSLLLFEEAKDRGRKGFWYAASGLSLYLAIAARIDAVKMLPAFALIGFLAVRKQGFDRRSLAWAGAFGGALAVDALLFTVFSEGIRLRYLELFPAVEGWAKSSAARNLGLWPMVKSLVSPFGAFGVLFPAAVAGAVLAWRKRELASPLIVGGWILATSLLVALLYRIGDGRHHAMLSPFVAWLAAVAVAAVKPAVPRGIVAASLALAGTVLFHVRLPPDRIAAYAELRDVLKGREGPVYADSRTTPALSLYFPEAGVRDFSREEAKAPCWIVDYAAMRAVDRTLYGRDPFPSVPTVPAAEIRVPVRGIPGIRELAAPLRRFRGVGSEGILLLKSTP